MTPAVVLRQPVQPRSWAIRPWALPVLCAILALGRSSNAKPPNIVWIVAENFSLDFGCYGANPVHTPNVDRLASQGSLFLRAYATSPVCAPSRSAFLTGMYATTTDTHNMRSHREDQYRLPAGVRPLTHRLQDLGYRTGNLKMMGDKLVGTGKLDLNFVREGPIYQTDDWKELLANEPFFAQINLPEAEYDIYDRKTKEKTRVPWVGEEWHPQIATADNVTPPPYYPDHPLVREEWARLLNSASGADVRVGWILEALKTTGVQDHTIVIFFADNGRLEPRGIHWCFDSGLHVPLIIYIPPEISAPSGYRAGRPDQRVVSLIDLAATTLALAGAPRPLTMQGRVLYGPDRDPERTYAFAARDRIDETVVTQRSVHDSRYHYIRNLTPGAGFPTLNRYKEKCFPVKPLMRKLAAEGALKGPPAELMRPFPHELLFDTQQDPHEVHNLVDSDEPEHRLALVRLRAALDTWIVETGDRGLRLEPPSVVAPFEREMDEWFGTPEWAKKNATR